MNRATINIAALLAIAMLFPSSERAASITLTAQPTHFSIGEISEISVNVSGLNGATGVSLGGFDFVLQYDLSAFTLSNTSFGDPFLGDQLDLSHEGSLAEVQRQANGVRFFELSLDDGALLNTSQANSFQLVSFTLTALANGQFPLTLTSGIFADSVGNNLAVQVSPAVLTVGDVTTTPEPQTCLLVMVPLTALMASVWLWERSRKCQA